MATTSLPKILLKLLPMFLTITIASMGITLADHVTIACRKLWFMCLTNDIVVIIGHHRKQAVTGVHHNEHPTSEIQNVFGVVYGGPPIVVIVWC